MHKNGIIHPLLFCLYPVLFLYARNVGQVTPVQVLGPLSWSLGITLAGVLLLRRVLTDCHKAGLIVSFVVLMYFSYGHFYVAVKGVQVWESLFKHRFLLPLWILLIALFAYRVTKTRKDLGSATGILNFVALLLLIMPITKILAYELGGARIHSLDKSNAGAGAQVTTKALTPDVYYIVLDGFANSATLKEIYGYDNGGFDSLLTQKGFRIVPDGRSNYALTELSLASTLNMQHLESAAGMPAQPDRRREIIRLIQNNRAVGFMKSRGYKIVHLGSGWGPTDRNPHADMVFRFGRDDFWTALTETTMLRPFDPFFIWGARERVLKTFAKLGEVPRIEGPKFVFVHFLVPHPPYLFGANGEPLRIFDFDVLGSNWRDKVGYLNQLIFTSRKVLETVDAILAKSREPPVIVIQSDHGPASTFFDPNLEDVEVVEDIMLRERMRILNAYYLPRGGAASLYPTITPVNSFCVIFKFYFSTDCKLQADESYYSNYLHPLQFLNATRRVTAGTAAVIKGKR